MESLPKNKILQFPSNALTEIRNIHNMGDQRRINDALDILEEWIRKQDHFLKKDFDRGYLERTLVYSKGSIEKAKISIDRLCTMKTLLPHFFLKTNVKEELRDTLDKGWLVPIPTLTDDFYRIFCVKAIAKDFTDNIILEFLQYTVILCEYIRAHDYFNGLIVVYDLRDINVLELVTKMRNNIVTLQQYVTLTIKGYGASIKGLHFLSQSKALDLLLNLVRQFFSDKIAKRIHVHKTLDELYTMVPKDLLPEDIGGKERSTVKLLDDCIEALSTKENVEYMKMVIKARTDETLRQSEQFNQDYMGMPGSFRSLHVD